MRAKILAAAAAAVALALLRRLLRERRRRRAVAAAAAVGRRKRLTAAVVGGGFGGILAVIKLREVGVEATIFEKAGSLGGTWRDNAYPGCACDVPSHLYSYSFAPNSQWTHKWSSQAEILEYLQGVARDHDVVKHVEFNSAVSSVRWRSEDSKWEVSVDGRGVVGAFDFVVSATGQLCSPLTPRLEGAQKFPGPQFHTARWDHEVDLTGKRVACIGSGASAIQAWPEVAKTAARAFVFQRTPVYVLPRGNYRYPAAVRAAFAYVPFLRAITRAVIYAAWEVTVYLGWLKRGSFLTGVIQRDAKRHFERELKDRAAVEQQFPKYPPGCRRVLLSDDWFPMLRRENVELVTEAVTALTETGVRTADGRDIPVDAVVYATGFASQLFVGGMSVVGDGGRTLSEVWKERPSAHLGVSVPGFPNFFVLYGPNTNLNHNSIIVMLEAQMDYVQRVVCGLAEQGASACSPSEAVMAAFQSETSERLSKSVWADPECGAGGWYKNASGEVVNNWFGSTVEYARRCGEVCIRDWNVR